MGRGEKDLVKMVFVKKWKDLIWGDKMEIN